MKNTIRIDIKIIAKEPGDKCPLAFWYTDYDIFWEIVNDFPPFGPDIGQFWRKPGFLSPRKVFNSNANDDGFW